MNEESLEEGSGPWPAFADLLAATSLLFLVLFAVVAIPAIRRAGELGKMQTSIDSLDARLHQVVAGSPGVSVRRLGDYLLIQIAEGATFDQKEFQLADLKPLGKSILRTLGQTIQEGSTLSMIDQIQVVGHASAEGGEEFNWRLSAARAATISLFLTDSVGLDPCKISALGRSHFYPVAPGAQRQRRTEDSLDRRIELEVRPLIPGDSVQRLRREQECVPGRIGQ